ncbi:MAG: 23S rRNA (pseudouridine(1915)-N(3))-methyltransferase RlmH [Pyrinomonadaceae bacterium]
MKFRFVWVGKTRNKNWKALQEEYLKRLSRFIPCEVSEARDATGPNAIEIEGNRILELLNPKCFAVLLEPTGPQLSSPGLAKRLQSWEIRSIKEIGFIIGGAQGVSSAVAERAHDRLSLSFLTFTHETARVILIEQLYRAYTILRGFPYHNE